MSITTVIIIIIIICMLSTQILVQNMENLFYILCELVFPVASIK